MVTWDWVAGFTLADGHIQWVEGKGKKHSTGGRIILAQGVKEPLEAIRRFLETEGITRAQLYQRKKGGGYANSKIWILSITDRDGVINFIKHTSTLLFHKREKAEYVLQRLMAMNKERKQIVAQAQKLREEGISILDDKDGLDSTSWRQDRIERGLCTVCGQPRGENATKQMCRPCANNHNVKTRERRLNAINNGLCGRCLNPREDLANTMCSSCLEYSRDYKRKKARASTQRIALTGKT